MQAVVATMRSNMSQRVSVAPSRVELPGIFAVGLAVLAVATALAAVPEPDGDLRRAVEEDWRLQEQRWGRMMESAVAVTAAVSRAEKVVQHRRDRGEVAVPEDGEATLRELQQAAAAVESLDAAQRAALYRRARWLTRGLIFQDPQVTGQPLLFMQRNRYICQMLHEYMGYFYDYGEVPPGGGVYLLERPGFSLKTRDVIRGRLPNGNFTTLALSADAKTVYFAFAERADGKPEFYSPERGSFHLFSVAPDGAGLRQLTRGVEDDRTVAKRLVPAVASRSD